MRAVISVANVAARSGKTTVAVNLAAEFSARGIKTLLVDTDPQARATPFFVKPDQIVRTLSDVLLPTMERDAPRAARVWDVFSPGGFTHLGVVAGDIRLAPFESLEGARVTDLHDRLGLISDFYDLVILDTPSSLALLTRASLCASTHVLVPVSPGGQGEEGVSLIEQSLGNMPCGAPPEAVWVVCNRFDCRDHSSGRLYERLAARWGGRLFDTIIHRDDRVEAYGERGVPVAASEQGTPGADLYARLADETLAKLRLTPA
ncbi:MAG: chromosome partitioning protein [Acidobacteriota bacterium]|jgi:chromosome partitioning protein|nr:chromosome partitioning protein [Acidobacteriota bacterium]